LSAVWDKDKKKVIYFEIPPTPFSGYYAFLLLSSLEILLKEIGCRSEFVIVTLNDYKNVIQEYIDYFEQVIADVNANNYVYSPYQHQIEPALMILEFWRELLNLSCNTNCFEFYS